MESQPINDGFWRRQLFIFMYKFARHRSVCRFWKHPGSIDFISSKLCVKATTATKLAEAHAMQVVAKHTTIPVPKVHCAFLSKGRGFIVMDRIDGRNLISTAWAHLSEESKAKILHQLKSMIDQLRQLTRPAERASVGNIGGGPFCDPRLPGKSFWGPFATVNEFHKALRKVFDEKDLDEERLPGIRDLSNFNILTRGDEVIRIIDWETAGWLQPYWQYSTAWNVNPQNEFWRDEVAKFITPMPYGLEMENIRRWYFGMNGMDI